MEYFDPKNKWQEYQVIRAQLENERASFLSHWRSLSDWILPRRARFSTSDVNKGDRRNQNIIDSTATLASRTMQSGMMGGLTSPARPWFRLTTPDPDMAEFGSVKAWLDTVSRRMVNVFLKSNLYNVLPTIYGDLGVFGTAAMIVEEDFDQTIRALPFAIGSYCISNNSRLRVDVFSREFRFTVRQLVEKFGEKDPKTGKPNWDNFSTSVKNLYDTGNYEAWVDVYHLIKPNREYDPRRLEAKYKKYSSCYFEAGSSAGTHGYSMTEPGKYLRESGYDFFPVLAPRWQVTGEDVYGTDCPGMTALGDIRALQTMQKRKSQAIEKMVNPPMVGPTSLKMHKATILPGDITYIDEREGLKGYRPAHEVNFRIGELAQDINETQQRISRAFYEDLFLMISRSDRREITAREIDERREEKLLALGPVLEQLNQDLLDPLIDIAFEIMGRQGLIPEPPEELQGMELKVEYISVMAQAQKLLGISSIERFAGFASQIAQVQPEALDKIDTDQMLDIYGESASVPFGIVRTDEAVGQIRQSRQQQQQAMQQQAMVQQAATSAKDLSQTSLEGDNALSRIIDQANAGNLTPAA